MSATAGRVPQQTVRLDLPGVRSLSPAWACGGGATLLVIFGLLLHLVSGEKSIWSSYWLVDASQGLAYSVVGILMATRLPRHVIAWLFLVVGASHALALAAGGVAMFGLERGAWPGVIRGAAWIESWVWAPGLFAVATFLPLLFPDGRVASPRFRPVVWTAGAGITLFVVGLAGGAAPSAYPTTKLLHFAWAEPLVSIGSIVVTASAAAALVAVISRYRQSAGRERLQLRWFAFAAVIAIGAAMPWIPENTSVMVQFFALPLVPIAAGVAILKHRLYELNVVVNRALVYFTVSGLLLGAYLAVVLVLGKSIGTRTVPNIIATAVVAVLFVPLRARVQRVIDRVMYGDRGEPYALVSRLSHELAGLSSAGETLERVVRTVSEALKLPYVGIILDVRGSPTVLSEVGRASGPTYEIPLAYAGRRLGALIVGHRSGEREFGGLDRRVLDDLAEHVSVAAYSTTLMLQLRRSRTDLVAAQAEERRRIRRELHDELGPRLAGVNLQAEAAAELIGHDPSAARAMLTKVAAEARRAIEDIRTLAYGLRPPALDDLGLVGAIEERAARLTDPVNADHLRISIEAPDELPPLPAAIEVAVYRVVLEALTNAVRHSQASHCTASLRFGEDVLVEVTDDGRGMGQWAEAGVGIASMRERVDELGGSLTIEDLAAGGTIVRAILPGDKVLAP